MLVDFHKVSKSLAICQAICCDNEQTLRCMVNEKEELWNEFTALLLDRLKKMGEKHSEENEYLITEIPVERIVRKTPSHINAFKELFFEGLITLETTFRELLRYVVYDTEAYLSIRKTSDTAKSGPSYLRLETIPTLFHRKAETIVLAKNSIFTTLYDRGYILVDVVLTRKFSRYPSVEATCYKIPEGYNNSEEIENDADVVIGIFNGSSDAGTKLSLLTAELVLQKSE